MQLTFSDIQKAIADDDDVWSFSNQILYDMCRNYPRHDQDQVIMAKILLIGRTYAAAIERRRPISDLPLQDSDKFYEYQVIPALKSSLLDQKLGFLEKYSDISIEGIPAILEVHAYLLGIFCQLTGLEKRSLASKYLHFHRPDLFYLYDSRACTGLRRIKPKRGVRPKTFGEGDPEYTRFFYQLFDLQQEINASFGVTLTPRQLDRLLLMRAV